MTIQWTDSSHPDFVHFSACLEEYFNQLAGGKQNRIRFIPYNALNEIHDVLLVYDGKLPIACGSFKAYAPGIVEMKRIYVDEAYRGKKISKTVLAKLEERAKMKGFHRAILQTRNACTAAVHLYRSTGYVQIDAYPPYDKLPLAVCFAKDL